LTLPPPDPQVKGLDLLTGELRGSPAAATAASRPSLYHTLGASRKFAAYAQGWMAWRECIMAARERTAEDRAAAWEAQVTSATVSDVLYDFCFASRENGTISWHFTMQRTSWQVKQCHREAEQIRGTQTEGSAAEALQRQVLFQRCLNPISNAGHFFAISHNAVLTLF